VWRRNFWAARPETRFARRIARTWILNAEASQLGAADPTLSGAALPVADQSSQGPAVTPSGRQAAATADRLPWLHSMDGGLADDR
jgi:hypothetical protein